MKSTKSYCLYFHKNAITGIVFYVGIGPETRARSKRSRNIHWIRTVNKYGYEIEIIERGLTWESAIEKEVFHISFFGRADLKTGQLVNMTAGGDGTPGHKHANWQKGVDAARLKNLGSKATNERRNNISKALSGRKIAPESVKKQAESRKINNALFERKNWNKGNKMSDEVRAKVSASKMGAVISKEHREKLSKALKGRIFSAEHRRKNSEATKGLKKTDAHKRKLSEATRAWWAKKKAA